MKKTFRSTHFFLADVRNLTVPGRTILLCLVTVLAMLILLSPMPVYADDTSTFAFDNDTGAKLWKTENAELIKKTGFKYAISEARVFNGRGSLAVSENLSASVDTTQTGGAFVNAESFGLSNLAGCTIKMEIYPVKEAMDAGASVTFYTDGMLYLPTTKHTWISNSWNTFSMVVPGNCQNTRIGFLIPEYSIYSGDVFYVDELTVLKPDGTAVANVGDYQAPVRGDNAEMSETDHAILVTVVFIAIAVVAVAAIGLAYYKLSTRYR